MKEIERFIVSLGEMNEYLKKRQACVLNQEDWGAEQAMQYQRIKNQRQSVLDLIILLGEEYVEPDV